MLDLLKFLQKERGQDLAEYALLIGLLALVSLLAVTFLGQEISSVFNAFAQEIASWNVPGFP